MELDEALFETYELAMTGGGDDTVTMVVAATLTACELQRT
jgi:hypothetical protein